MSSKTAGLQYSPARKWCKVILATLLGVVGLFGAYIYGVTANVHQTASALDNMEILPHHRSFGQLSMSSAPEATPSNAASIVERIVPDLGGSFCDISLVGAYVCEPASFIF